MELKQLLTRAYELSGSDIFIVPGAKVTCKVKGDMVPLSEEIVRPAETEQLVREAYDLAHRDIARLQDMAERFMTPVHQYGVRLRLERSQDMPGESLRAQEAPDIFAHICICDMILE